MYYGTVEGFKAYHEARGRTTVEWDDDQIEPQLLVASEWLDDTFRDQFDGYKVSPLTQEREWPRTGVVDYYGNAVASASVPVQIERATYEAALRLLADPAVLAPDYTPNKYKRVKVEGAIEVDYSDASGAALRMQIPAIGQVLSSLLNWRGAVQSAVSGRVVRG